MVAYTPERTVGNSQNSITQTTINELNAALSRKGKSVLLALYRSPRIQQKVLAVSINTSPNSLSNLLGKMETIRPVLLDIEHIGRSKYYSLTNIAKQYVCSALIPKETYNINTFFSVPAETSLSNETLEILYQFQHLAGSEWLLILDDLLSNGQDTGAAADDLTNLYTRFIRNMRQMYLRKDSLSIRKIYSELSNSILVSRLENYLKDSLQDSHALIPLFDLEKQNPKKVIELINYVFAEMKPHIFGKDDLACFPNNELPVSEEQYHAIFHRISIMVNEFSNHYRSKLQALKTWEKAFYASNVTLTFIAEKCYMVQLAEFGKPSQNDNANATL